MSCCASAASGANSAVNEAKAFIKESACLTNSQIKSVGALMQQYNAYKNMNQQDKCKQKIVLFLEIPASCCVVAISGMNGEISKIRVITKGKQCISPSDAAVTSSHVGSYSKFKKSFIYRKYTQSAFSLPYRERALCPLNVHRHRCSINVFRLRL